MLEVVELLEGELGLEANTAGPVFVEAAEALKKVLAAESIADVAEREAQAAGASMYYI